MQTATLLRGFLLGILLTAGIFVVTTMASAEVVPLLDAKTKEARELLRTLNATPVEQRVVSEAVEDDIVAYLEKWNGRNLTGRETYDIQILAFARGKGSLTQLTRRLFSEI